MGQLHVGDKAPDFTLDAGDGSAVSLSDLKGKPVVLYFYPRDNTPGCTKEACSFRDEFSRFTKKGAVILGVSADSIDSHRKFSEKYDLPFPLLSDEKKKTLKAYGVWKKKRLYGKDFMGIERTTFVISPQGKIAAIFPRVRVEDHAEEVLAAL